MSEPSFGSWLRRERERRGTTLRAIADQTKVSLLLLEGLEADDLSRWPAGIFRRAFVRSYAAAIGLDPGAVVRRFESELVANDAPRQHAQQAHPDEAPPAVIRLPPRAAASTRTRLLGTAADLTVALVLGLGSAAAGSRLLWPVVLIAVYYALGIMISGTSPMVALLNDLTSRSGEEPRAPSRHQPAGVTRSPGGISQPVQ